ncbi:hypothetical protein [Flavobacterium fluviale]|nr:hypothetical protein [Flavobacterium fluviale]
MNCKLQKQKKKTVSLIKGNSGSWDSPKEIREELRNLKSEF